MSRTKYALNVAAILRQQKTLAVTSNLQLAKADNDEMPLSVYSTPLSRYTFAIIDKTQGDTICPTANVPVNMIPDIIKRSDYAFAKQLDAELNADGEAEGQSGTSPAYTVRFRTGQLKGMTPAEVLSQQGEGGIATLNGQYTFLKSNLAQYPGNKVLMDAIMDAANLMKTGKLQTVQTKATKKLTILREIPKPLIRKKRPDGMCPVYMISIAWTIGEKYPVEVTIVNMYAPVKESANGTLQPQLGAYDKASYKKSVFSLAAEEWNSMIAAIDRNMRQFETMTSRAVFDDALNADRANRAEHDAMARTA